MKKYIAILIVALGGLVCQASGESSGSGNSSAAKSASNRVLHLDGQASYVRVADSQSLHSFTNAITIEVWIKPANTTQAGPARIVTVSKDPGQRNFTLGQKGSAYEVRLRTTSTSPNGEPSLSSPGADDAMPCVCGLRSEKGDLGVLYFSAGGRATIKPSSLKENLKAQWFNPRSGKRTTAQTHEENAFIALDEQDWVLLLQQKP